MLADFDLDESGVKAVEHGMPARLHSLPAASCWILRGEDECSASAGIIATMIDSSNIASWKATCWITFRIPFIAIDLVPYTLRQLNAITADGSTLR